MVSGRPSSGRAWVIFATLFIAYVLSAVPLPVSWQIFIPDWVTLTLIYWCLALPKRVGPGAGFFVGLFLDLVNFSLFGQHAFSKSIVAYLAQRAALRVRMFPVIQQAFFVTILLAIDALLIGSIQLVTTATGFEGRWFGPLVGGLIWPGIYVTLRATRRWARLR
jgi:rod shape-determining protein MreD